MVYGKPRDAVGLDPHNVTDGESFDVTQMIFDTLVRYKEGKTEVEPALAVSWRVSKGGREWTFQLRRGVRFHDGTPFDANAVVFSFERQMYRDPPYHQGSFEYWPSIFGGYPGIVKKVKATGRHTVTFLLQSPSAPFLLNLAMPSNAILSPMAVKKHGQDFFKHPVGTGPFRLIEWIPNERIVLQANETYWGGRPYLRELIYRLIPENAVRLLELEKGSIDAMHGINPDDAERIKRNRNLILHTQPGLNVGYLAFNTEKKPFDDKRVRQALSMAVDKGTLVRALFRGYGVAAKNPIPPIMWGYNDGVKPCSYDPRRARMLLAQAGYPNGFKTTLWAMPVARPYMPDPKKMAEALQEYFRAVGVEARIISYDWGTYLEKTSQGEHDMMLLGWTGDNGDPDNFLHTLLSSDAAIRGSANNRAFYRNQELDTILKRAQRALDRGGTGQAVSEGPSNLSWGCSLDPSCPCRPARGDWEPREGLPTPSHRHPPIGQGLDRRVKSGFAWLYPETLARPDSRLAGGHVCDLSLPPSRSWGPRHRDARRAGQP